MNDLPTITFEAFRLANGLQVILHRDNRIPLVHLSLHYRVGSSFEEPGASGFAHLFEHMMFQGSDNVGKNEHGRHVDAAGGRWNASTGKDRTNYYETLPSHYLELGLWLEADRMRSLKITAENFENQRKTVIEEKKQSYDNRPYGRAFLRFDELAYQNWAYGHPIIGSVADLERATLDDVLAFHRRYYGPGNATLVLAGDFDEAAARAKVEAYFGEIPDRTAAQAPDLTEPVQLQEKREKIPDPLAVLPVISMGFKMAELGSTDYYALSVLSIILGQGSSSRLYRRLVYENNWISGLSAGANQYRGPELFCLWLQVQTGVAVDQVLDSVDEELEDLRVRPVAPAELEKAHHQITHNFVSRLATLSRIGELLAHYAVFFDDPGMINRELGRFLAVTPETILEAAQRTFDPRKRTLITVEPAAGGGA